MSKTQPSNLSFNNHSCLLLPKNREERARIGNTALGSEYDHLYLAKVWSMVLNFVVL